METASRRPVDPRQDRASPRGLGGDTRRAGRQRSSGGRATASRAIVRGWTALSRPLRSRSAAAPVALRALSAAVDSSTCFLISTLLLRELSRNQVSKKTQSAWLQPRALTKARSRCSLSAADGLADAVDRGVDQDQATWGTAESLARPSARRRSGASKGGSSKTTSPHAVPGTEASVIASHVPYPTVLCAEINQLGCRRVARSQSKWVYPGFPKTFC